MNTDALETLKTTALVVSDPEAYKFTSLPSFLKTLELTPYEADQVDLSKFVSDAFTTLIFVDGKLQSPVSVPGLSFHDLRDHQETLTASNPLSQLHHSLAKSGVVIEVAKKTKIEKPLRLVNLVTRSGVTTPVVILKARSFSEVSLIEEAYDQSVSYLFVGETYIDVEASAKVEHVQLSHGSVSSLLHTSTIATVHRDATYRNVLLNLSGKLNRRNLSLELLESGAHGESFNLYLTSGSEHSDINTVIHHRAADTTSNQIAKGILDGESKGIFTGKIFIHPQSQRVVSGQINKNLILSQKAQVHSQPQLEIFADDVKCSHGSTTGQLSPDEVFYFQARGIPADKAKTLLAHGFGLEVVLKIEDMTIRSLISEIVMKALEDKFRLGDRA